MIEIIDDFLPSPIYERLYDTIFSYDFPWFYLKDTTYRVKYSDDEALWDDGFSHLIYLMKRDLNYEFKSPVYEALYPVISHCNFMFGNRIGELSRCKANLTLTSISNDPFEPHVDQPDFDNITGLLCVNNSDGPTYIYENVCPVGSSTKAALEMYRTNKDSFKIIHEIEPKANRMVLFDGNIYHSGSRPTKHKTRINLNFNWARPK